MRTLIWKELREHVRWLPLGLIVSAAVCYLAAPSRHTDALLAARLVTQLAIVTPLLAFTLGVVQAYRDLRPAGAAYLNHRSVTAHQIFMAKTIAGFAIYASAVVIPLLLLAAWIAIQGMYWVPMRPAQVIPALVFALASFALHPAAMLMLARDASWWGTRVFPIIPAAAALVPLCIFLTTGGMAGAGLGLMVAAFLIAWLTFVARQGWSTFAPDPPASLNNQSIHRRWLLSSNLIAAALCTVVAAVFTTLTTVEGWSRRLDYTTPPYNGLAVEPATGSVWLMTLHRQYDPQSGLSTVEEIGGDNIENGKTVNPLRSENLPTITQPFVYLYTTRDIYPFGDGFFSRFASLSDKPAQFAYDSRGYMLRYAYVPQIRWQAIIAADGVFPSGKLQGRPFTSNPLNSIQSAFSRFYESGYAPPLADANGVYLLSPSGTQIRKLIDQRVDAIASIDGDAGHAPRLVIRSNNQLLEYQLLDVSGSDEWFEQADPEDPVSRTRSKSLYDLEISAKLINTIEMPAELRSLDQVRIARSHDGWYFATTWSDTTLFHLTSQGHTEAISFQLKPGTSSPPNIDQVRVEPLIAGALPGTVYIAGAAIVAWESFNRSVTKPLAQVLAENPRLFTTGLVSFLLVTLFSLWLTRRVAQRRGLSRGQMRLWSWSVLLLGLAAPLAVVAIYCRVVREPCPQCQQLRRVDEDRCEHCGAQWEPPQAEGIEITDTHRFPLQAEGVPA